MSSRMISSFGGTRSRKGRNGGDGLMEFRGGRILTVRFSTHIGDYSWPLSWVELKVGTRGRQFVVNRSSVQCRFYSTALGRWRPDSVGISILRRADNLRYFSADTTATRRKSLLNTMGKLERVLIGCLEAFKEVEKSVNLSLCCSRILYTASFSPTVD